MKALVGSICSIPLTRTRTPLTLRIERPHARATRWTACAVEADSDRAMVSRPRTSVATTTQAKMTAVRAQRTIGIESGVCSNGDGDLSSCAPTSTGPSPAGFQTDMSNCSNIRSTRPISQLRC